MIISVVYIWLISSFPYWGRAYWGERNLSLTAGQLSWRQSKFFEIFYPEELRTRSNNGAKQTVGILVIHGHDKMQCELQVHDQPGNYLSASDQNQKMKVYMKSHGKRLRKCTLESKNKMPRNPAKCYEIGDLVKNTRAHNWALGQSPL